MRLAWTIYQLKRAVSMENAWEFALNLYMPASDIVNVRIQDLDSIKIEPEEHELCYGETEHKEYIISNDNSSRKAGCDVKDAEQPDIKLGDSGDNVKCDEEKDIIDPGYHMEIKMSFDEKEVITSNIEKQNIDPTAVKIELEHELNYKWFEVEKTEDVKVEANMEGALDIEGNDSKYCEQKTVKKDGSWDELTCDHGQEQCNETKVIKCDSGINKEKIDPEDVDIEKCTEDETTSVEDLESVGVSCENNYNSVRWYHCKYYCGYKTRNEHAVKKHLQKKHEEGPQWYNCNHCEFKTINRYSLKRHEYKHNENTRWYKCLHCEFKSKDRYYFTNHLKSEHDGNTEWYKCKYCTYKTKRRNHLKSHFKYKHDDTIEWYHCHICEYRTKYKSHLKNHFKNKHNQNVEWYHCEHCLFKAKSKNNLVRHLKHKHDSIEWYQCQYCEYRIKYKYDLKKHFLNMHNQDIEWLQCQYCVFKTKHKKSYKLHLKNKHGDSFDWHQCRFCEFKTKWRSYLKEHFRRKHENEEDNKLMASSI